MTPADEKLTLAEAWQKIRALVEKTAHEHWNDTSHDLCPWGFDASELDGALNYIDEVLRSQT